MDRLVLEFEVRRDLAIERPRAETPTDLVFLGFGENLLDAVRQAARDVMQFLTERAGLELGRGVQRHEHRGGLPRHPGGRRPARRPRRAAEGSRRRLTTRQAPRPSMQR